jgi:hypothetical protein
MSGVAEGAELVGRLVQRVEILEELLFGQLFLREAPFGLFMGVDKLLHSCSPWLSVAEISCICTTYMADVYGIRDLWVISVLLLGIPHGVGDKCIMPPE